MEIYYTNKTIFWSNSDNNFLEKSVFDSYLNDWVQLPNTKSINWDNHYSANFFASDNFNATYFKIIKNNFTYYFFIEDIQFDSVRGRHYYLTMDFYNTYSVNLIETLKQNNQKVFFNRKHISTVGIDYNLKYLNMVPDYLMNLANYIVPTKKYFRTNFKTSINDVWYSYNDYDKKLPGILVSNYNTRFPDNKYYYLKIKKPTKPFNSNGTTIADTWYNGVQIFYLPICTSGEYNNFNEVSKIPSDYVVGLVRSYVPPGCFSYYMLGSDFFNNAADSSLKQLKLLMLLPSGNEVFECTFYDNNPSHQDLWFIDNGIDVIPRNINSDFQSLYLYPFTKWSLNNSYDFYANSYISNVNTITISHIISTTIQTCVKPPQNSYNYNTYYSNLYMDMEEVLPYVGNVYTNYLNNNINSMNTGIALAKKQKELQDTFAIKQGVSDIASGLFNSFLGVISFNLNPISTGFNLNPFSDIGKVISASNIGSGLSQVSSGVIGMQKELAFNEFNLESKIANMKAKVADIGGRPAAMLDTYGEGVSRTTLYSLELVKHTLPDNYKKLVAYDYYFKGIIVNELLNFNEYNKYRLFNYFEIKDAFQLASKYFKYPKRILKDIAKQIEKGIRLWKTTNFDYSGESDNVPN